MLGSKEVLTFEMDYWNNVKLNEVSFLPFSKTRKSNVTALAISFNKELIAVGHSNGTV
jgi:hypothetical protein